MLWLLYGRRALFFLMMVLHDLHRAARFSDDIIALKDGEVVKAGLVKR